MAAVCLEQIHGRTLTTIGLAGFRECATVPGLIYDCNSEVLRCLSFLSHPRPSVRTCSVSSTFRNSVGSGGWTKFYSSFLSGSDRALLQQTGAYTSARGSSCTSMEKAALVPSHLRLRLPFHTFALVSSAGIDIAPPHQRQVEVCPPGHQPAQPLGLSHVSSQYFSSLDSSN